MRTVCLLFACLACAGHARRAEARSKTDDKSLAALAQLLHSTNPAAGFQVNVAGLNNRLRSPSARSVSPCIGGRGSDVAMCEITNRERRIPVADMQRRTILNIIVLACYSVPVGWLGFCYISAFIPVSSGSGDAGVIASDAQGTVVTFEGWLKTHDVGSRQLVQGINGDATYLIVEPGKKIRDYALNAVCTHLGCVVPWNRAQNKFMCPCHGSQYDETGKVVRGPAPLSLALARVTDTGDGKITIKPWKEKDFRTGLDPWWK